MGSSVASCHIGGFLFIGTTRPSRVPFAAGTLNISSTLPPHTQFDLLGSFVGDTSGTYSDTWKGRVVKGWVVSLSRNDTSTSPRN